jgi:hypothetical protein
MEDTRVNEVLRERSQRIGHLIVHDHGDQGCRIEVMAGRDQDEWPAVLLNPAEEKDLAAWLVAEPDGFAAFLGRECPPKGPGRGRRSGLARVLNGSLMLVTHWVRGHSSPGPEHVAALAAFFHTSPKQSEAMILADVRVRAERTWRSRATAEKVA